MFGNVSGTGEGGPSGGLPAGRHGFIGTFARFFVAVLEVAAPARRQTGGPGGPVAAISAVAIRERIHAAGLEKAGPGRRAPLRQGATLLNRSFGGGTGRAKLTGTRGLYGPGLSMEDRLPRRPGLMRP